MMTKDEADNALRQAIIDHAKAYGIDEPGELLSEFGIVAAWTSIEQDGRTWYTTQFHMEQVPAHICVGLFEIGIESVLDEDFREA